MATGGWGDYKDGTIAISDISADSITIADNNWTGWTTTATAEIDTSVKTAWRDDSISGMKVLRSTWQTWNEKYNYQTGMAPYCYDDERLRNQMVDMHLQVVQGERAAQGINEPVKTHADLERERVQEEQRLERIELERIERELEMKELKEKEEKAEETAKELLKSLISEADYELYLKEGYIQVESKGGKVYRIKPRDTIEILKGGAHENSLCIVTKDTQLPASDEVLWKKLMVEADEKELLAIGCRQG